jgi:macrolide transport system ATP-binding/permease protein
MNGPLLKLENVGYTYNSQGVQFAALSRVNLEIHEGELTAIVGPSGSGKSTLLNILGLLARPTEGQAHIFGHALDSLQDVQLAQLRNQGFGFVFQNFSLISRLTVLENILLPTAFEPTTNPDVPASAADTNHTERALALLRRFGIESLSERLPHELSGGQKQRVAICRAMILKPRLLLADEPTGALDTSSAQNVLAMLEELHREGCTVVVITHDPDVAQRAVRIISVRDGTIVDDQRREPHDDFSKQRPNAYANASSMISTASSQRSVDWTDLHHMVSQSIMLAKRSLATHRGRSVLTGLGLFIGILSLIVINGLGEIVNNSFSKLFYTSSVRKAFIYYDSGRGGFHDRRSSDWRGLHADVEFPRLVQLFAKKGIIRPFVRSDTCRIRSNSGGFRSTLSGVNDVAEFIEMDAPLSGGRWANEGEFSSGSAVTVLGSETVDQLFKSTDPRRRNGDFPVGEKITVDNCDTLVTLTIVGVLSRRDTTMGNRDANDVIYVPTRTLLMRKGPTYFRFFSVLPKEGIDSRQLANELVNYLSLQTGGQRSFASIIPAETLERVRGFLWIIQAIVGFIGGLCLFVGGVGIMNMMLVTVAERTREIGLLKCLGAQNFHIRSYILTESVLLCFWAGCAAVVFGLMINNLFAFCVSVFVPMLKDFRWVIAPVGLSLGLVVSVGCGLGFGALPAARAARLDPADCLRAE